VKTQSKEVFSINLIGLSATKVVIGFADQFSV